MRCVDWLIVVQVVITVGAVNFIRNFFPYGFNAMLAFVISAISATEFGIRSKFILPSNGGHGM